ncbi:hypothetical protein LRC484719_52760 [Mycobacterium riyadhense]
MTETGGLLVQVNGRSAAPVIDWLGQRDGDWRESITHVAIDMSVTHAKAVRVALLHAQLIVDRFHLVKRANQMARRCGGAPPGTAGAVAAANAPA